MHDYAPTPCLPAAHRQSAQQWKDRLRPCQGQRGWRYAVVGMRVPGLMIPAVRLFLDSSTCFGAAAIPSPQRGGGSRHLSGPSWVAMRWPPAIGAARLMRMFFVHPHRLASCRYALHKLVFASPGAFYLGGRRAGYEPPAGVLFARCRANLIVYDPGHVINEYT